MHAVCPSLKLPSAYWFTLPSCSPLLSHPENQSPRTPVTLNGSAEVGHNRLAAGRCNGYQVYPVASHKHRDALLEQVHVPAPRPGHTRSTDVLTLSFSSDCCCCYELYSQPSHESSGCCCLNGSGPAESSKETSVPSSKVKLQSVVSNYQLTQKN